jgi:hypothetical protein
MHANGVSKEATLIPCANIPFVTTSYQTAQQSSQQP